MKSPIDGFFGYYRFLSNFYPVDIQYQGLRYSSVEAAYQAAKTLNWDHRKALTQMDGSQAKSFSRQKSFVVRKDWSDELKLLIMEKLLRKKFDDPRLAEFLIATEDAPLIEGNTWGDVFWGVCNSEGKNHLGKLLMKIRDDLQGELDD